MKYILMSVVVVTLIAVGLGFAGNLVVDELNEAAQERNAQPKPNQITQISTTEYEWYQDPQAGYNLAMFKKPLKFLFTPEQAQSLKEQALVNQLELAVNGSYFMGSYVEAQHSGLLKLQGLSVSEYVPNVQISHVIVYDHLTDKLKFVRAKELNISDYSDARYSLIQTGPIVIEDGKIQIDFIKGSLNGELAAFRTLLGTTNDGYKFALVTTQAYKLEDLAGVLLKNPLLQSKQVNVINLDGGASTAMFSSDYDQFNFRDSSRLPLVIGVEKAKSAKKK